MIVLWITLLLFKQADLLSPVKTVEVGEPVTFLCSYSSTKTVQWFKQSHRETFRLIVTLRKFTASVYGPDVSASRFDAKMNDSMSSLTILRTTQEDEGIYHCAVIEWTITSWTSTYLLLKGAHDKTSNLSVVQWPSVTDPLHTGDLITLQCSVLSDSDSKTCSGGHSVYWFRAGSDNSYPDFIYTDENRSNKCDQRSNAQKSCVYNFSKSVGSSDDGTYYCAVAACGRILYGNGTKVDIVRRTHQEWLVLGILIVCLVISVIGNILLLCKQKGPQQQKGVQTAISEVQADNTHLQTDADDELNYAALNFTVKKTRGRKKRELTGDGVYAHVKC